MKNEISKLAFQETKSVKRMIREFYFVLGNLVIRISS